MPPSQLVGTRAQVFHGTARQTAYGKKGLRRNQLRKNKNGKIVSIKASNKAKSKGTLKKWMKKEGLCVKKGKFGLQKKGKTSKATKSKSKKKTRSKGKGTRGKRCRHSRGSKKGKYRSCYSYNR